MLSFSLSSFADNKKEEQQKRLAILEQLIGIANAPWDKVPEMLSSDQKAFDYCKDILWLSDEQFSQDTASINEWFRKLTWVSNNQTFPDPKEIKKKELRQYSEPQLSAYYHCVLEQMWTTAPRHKILIEYCERVLERRKIAKARTMPEGSIKRLEYREYGSSRPNEVFYKIERDSTLGTFVLSGYVNREIVKKAIDDNVLQQIRTMIEDKRLYKELNMYEYPPAFPECPLPDGGPPSWYFYCELEGGSVNTEAESKSVPSGCETISEFLRQILEGE